MNAKGNGNATQWTDPEECHARILKIIKKRKEKTMLDFGYYNMDCMEGMKQFPNRYFDLAILFYRLCREINEKQ